MQQQLINRSPDLKRLQQEGFELEIVEGYAIVHHIPYLDRNKCLHFGKLISSLNMSDNRTITPNDHVIYFMGDHPCDKDGNRIAGISHAEPNQRLSNEIIMNYSFSNKPQAGYFDYYQKFKRYIDIIIAPAISMHPEVKAQTHIVRGITEMDSPFVYTDTNSSRATLGNINDCFSNQKIGIVGLGGTGSYILDMVSKTKVKEIHLFDGDDFLQHNAFRSPGAAPFEEVSQGYKKVEYFGKIYSNMHKGIIPHPFYLADDSMHFLNDLSFVFVCVDSNSTRQIIFSSLINREIPFIDVGLGVEISNGKLSGNVRVTTAKPGIFEHLQVRTGIGETEENIYASNIQIADLNALNALLAVIKWKKMLGYYPDLVPAYHSVFTVDTGKLLYEDFTEA